MSILFTLLKAIFWRPLFNGFVWFYTVVPLHDPGIAVIALTIVIQIIITPFRMKAKSAQNDLARIQPELKKIQEIHKDNREAQGKAMMELYAKHRVNPLSGCLITLIQLPILIALFEVFRRGFDPAQLTALYSFVANPGTLNSTSFGFLDLARPNIYLGILAALTQFYQTKLASPPVPGGDPKSKERDFAHALQKQTQYLFPVFILIWSFTFPSALIVYWTVSNIFSILQEILMRPRSVISGITR